MKSYMREIKYNSQHVRKVLELNYALLSEFNFPFSKRHNALHGIPSMAAILSGMSLHRACANEASRMTALEAARNVPEEDVAGIHPPTSQWALGVIGAIKDPDEMEERCGRVADITVGAMGAAGMIPEAPVGAIDGHNMENYSKRLGEEYTIRSKFKNGTTKFIPALTSVIVSGPYTIHTACRLMRRGRPRAEYIAHLLDDNAGRGVYCSHYLVDREFFNVASMSEFTKRGEHFLMYARMTDGVKKALGQYLAGTRPAVSEYIVKSGRIRFTGTLVFQKKTEMGEDGKERTVVLPFFSNLPRPRVEKAVDLLRARAEKKAEDRGRVQVRRAVHADDDEQLAGHPDVHVPLLPCHRKHVGPGGPHDRSRKQSRNAQAGHHAAAEPHIRLARVGDQEEVQHNQQGVLPAALFGGHQGGRHAQERAG